MLTLIRVRKPCHVSTMTWAIFCHAMSDILKVPCRHIMTIWPPFFRHLFSHLFPIYHEKTWWKNGEKMGKMGQVPCITHDMTLPMPFFKFLN